MRVRLPRERLTIGSLMVVVALIGGVLAMARLFLPFGILAAVALILSVVRTSLTIDWLRERDRTVEADRVTGILIDSLNRSACLVTATTLAYFTCLAQLNPTTSRHISPSTWMFSLLPAFGALYWLRRLYWPPPLRPGPSDPPPPD